ncbi:recombination directionality factor [Comamonas suwonensis]|uniref:Phage capsid protein n=1 Tax=Comamonas suwonensis TaxID=2606214 RepID=A0A843B7B4_9BURK|nr:phage capsid protein [Comamonas suwonensis]MBI1626683.1 phage capsid protein [Comamonas suwonensis]
MIKGLMITPPVIGRIAIGKVVERNGKRLPEKDDEFTITTQVQSRGQWILHPLDETLRLAADKTYGSIKEGSQPSLSDGGEGGLSTADLEQATQPIPTVRPIRSGKRSLKEKIGVAADANPGQAMEPASSPSLPASSVSARRKLRSIPVRVLFNDPDLNLRAHYTLFDRTTARPVCVGDGENCKRVSSKGLESMPCPGPDICLFGKEGCKPYGRLNLIIGDSDELGSFVFRTTGFNSIRTLAARLRYFAAVSGGHLASMPLELKLRGKSTTQSHRSAIYYADLIVRSGLSLNAAIGQARELTVQRKTAGFDQTALDEAARQGFANGNFEDAPDEAAEIVEEFYPEECETPTAPTTAAANEHWPPIAQASQRNGTHSPYP